MSRFVLDISVTVLNKIKRINHSCQPLRYLPADALCIFWYRFNFEKNILLKDCCKRDCVPLLDLSPAISRILNSPMSARYLNFSTNITAKNALRRKYIIHCNTLAIHPQYCVITSQLNKAHNHWPFGFMKFKWSNCWFHISLSFFCCSVTAYFSPAT